MFRPDNPLLPNYKWVPIGYHGRASSIVVSGTRVRRPSGQTRAGRRRTRPAFGPSRGLDYELELGAFVGPGNALGEPIPIAERRGRTCSASASSTTGRRATSRPWEYQPLGPFLAKNFATTISPVGRDAGGARAVPRAGRSRGPRATRSRCPTSTATATERAAASTSRSRCWLRTRAMREQGLPPSAVSRSNFARPLLDARADGGAPHQQRLQPAPGRPARERHGLGPGERDRAAPCSSCTWRGKEPIALPDGETAQLPGGRRRGDPARLLRARGLRPHRLRRVPGRHPAAAPSRTETTASPALHRRSTRFRPR